MAMTTAIVRCCKRTTILFLITILKSLGFSEIRFVGLIILGARFFLGVKYVGHIMDFSTYVISLSTDAKLGLETALATPDPYPLH